MTAKHFLPISAAIFLFRLFWFVKSFNSTLITLSFIRYEERKSKQQDPTEYTEIESLCLTNGGIITESNQYD